MIWNLFPQPIEVIDCIIGDVIFILLDDVFWRFLVFVLNWQKKSHFKTFGSISFSSIINLNIADS